MALAVKAFHWFSVVVTLPFAVVALFVANPEKVKVAKENVRTSVPHWFLHIVTGFSHLTVVSHETIAAYFVLAVLRDHGLVGASGVELAKDVLIGELFYSTALAVALFVAVVFWGSCILSPALMIPADMWFPKDTPPAKIRKILFQFVFEPQGPQQKGFCNFMIYVHTVCPLLVALDIFFVEHALGGWWAEVVAVLAYGCGYLAWNFFCWWFLRQAPYPLQARIWALGLPAAAAIYGALVCFTVLLLQYTRALRRGGLLADWLLLALPLLLVVWASTGLYPLKRHLARFQGVDLASD